MELPLPAVFRIGDGVFRRGSFMSKNLIRFFYYWRLPLLFFLLFFVLLWLGSSLEGDLGGIIGAIWLFIDIPCLLFFTVRSVFLRIRSAITYCRTGIRDEVFIFPEVDALRGAVDIVADEIDSVKGLSSRMKLRYFAFRLLGVGLIIGGIVGCFYFAASNILLVLFSLVIIAGATLWITANHESYNNRVESVRMVPSPEELTAEQLYPYLRTIPTSLGSPRFAAVRGFKKPILVYGSEMDGFIYGVYRARLSDSFYVSTLASFSLKEPLPPAEVQIQKESRNAVWDPDDYLPELTAAVEEAVARASA